MENEEIRDLPNLSFINTGRELHVDSVKPVNSNEHQTGEQKRKKQDPPPRQETRDRFDELANAAAKSNAILVQSHSPYRFCVYKKGDEIFIDLVTLDKNGKIGAIRMQNITHDDFSKWIRHIEEREGLFLDETG